MNDVYAYLKGGMSMTKEEAYKSLCSILYNGIKSDESYEDHVSFYVSGDMEVEVEDGVLSVYDRGDQTLIIDEGITCIARASESKTIVRASIALLMVTDYFASKNLHQSDEDFSEKEYYEQMANTAEILARGIMVSVNLKGGNNNHD